MTLDLAHTADAELVATAVTEVLEKEGGLAARRDSAVRAAGISEALWRTVTRLGYGALTVPESLGGAGLGVGVAARAHRAYGRVLAPVPVLECGLLVPRLLAEAAPELATAVAAGERLGTVDIAGLAADRAVVEVRDGRASGQVARAPFGAVAEVLVARTAAGICAVDLSGVGREPRTDLAGQGLAEITLDGAPVLAEAPPPSRELIATARVLLAGYAVGAADAALELAVGYARERRQFGVPIGSFQAIQHRLADVATALHAADLLVSRAAWALDTGHATVDGAVVLAWRAAVTALGEAGRAAVQTLGGYGFTLEYDAHLFYRHAKAVEVAFGPDRGYTAAEIGAVRARDDTVL